MRETRLVFILDTDDHSDWLVGQPYIVRFMRTRDSANDNRACVIRRGARGPLLSGLRSSSAPGPVEIPVYTDVYTGEDAFVTPAPSIPIR